MALTVGAQLGSLEITALLGKGGMGEVYRARDMRLKREVAIKILPEEVSRDADRVSRFQREAEVLASLNHPNIAAIYDVAEANGSRFLVLELVEGDTLADRIARGPIPIGETLLIAKQITEALEAAHEKGIIHRDLKPANIKITADGKVKVLDFGLAKVSDSVETDSSSAPTKVTATMPGMILGTAGYMAPEQLNGKNADRTSDVWAFGCVLYEMLAGRLAFDGESAPEIVGRIIATEPDWNRLPAAIPAGILKLLRRCLQKERRQRLHDISDARIEIQEVLSAPVGAETTTAVRTRSRERLAWLVAGALALIAMALTVNLTLRTLMQQPAQAVHLTAEIGVDANLNTIWGPSAILSPDGTRLVLLAAEVGRPNRLYVRPLDQFQATALSGTEGASGPFFSPNGQWIGFFAQGTLKKIPVQGGTAIALCDARNDLGGSWGEDDTIVFAASPSMGAATLFKISSKGGTPQPLIPLDTQAGEFSQRWPQVLSGGKAVLFTSYKSVGMARDADVVVYSASSHQRKTVQRGGSYARYVPSGHIVYVHDGTMFVVPFDVQRLEVTGQPAPVLEDVVSAPANGGAQFSLSNAGSLVYVPGSSAPQNVAIYWMDREGKFTPLRETPGDYYNPALSPNGKRLALEIHNGNRSDIWVYDEEGDILTRLTFAGENNSYPVWTPDGQRIVYTSQDKAGSENLWWIRADGSGDAQRITQGQSIQHARSWRPDGKVLAFRQYNPSTSWDIMTVAIDGNEKSGWKAGEPQPFANSVFYEMEPAFSPDGRWLAYASSESGSFEVYVRTFPGLSGKGQVSNGGGNFPKWSSNGKELFYRTPNNKITVVTYTASGDSFHPDKPQLWSPGEFPDHWLGFIMYNFDPHPDGKRFVVLKVPDTERNAVNKVNMILNWFEELKQRGQVH